MFSIGMPELILIFAVALIVFGPRKLPEIGRIAGKAVREFKKAADDFNEAINREPPPEITGKAEIKTGGNEEKPKKEESTPGG